MAKQQRKLTVLKRAEIKKASASYGVQAGDLMFLVQNDQEDVYTTTLRNNGHHTCTCKGNAQFGRKCYHISHCEHQENIRRESAKLAPEFAAKSLPVWAIWLVEAGVLVAPKQESLSSQKVESPVGISEKEQVHNDLSGKILQFKKDWGTPSRQKEDWTTSAPLANSRAFKII